MISPDFPLPRSRRLVKQETTDADKPTRLSSLFSFLKAHPELLGLLVLAGILNFWNLEMNGYANTYYSGAVKSMSESWHNFLYASFDSKGVMTTDKPPLSLWIQALSVRVFGYHTVSYLAPQALMGMASVGFTYDLVRRYWGRIAGAVAGLALALTPIAVAVSRHNNPDALLVLCSVLAVWAAVRGLHESKTRWILLAGVFVGLGFETKMGAALFVVPGIALGWFYIANKGRKTASLQLLASGTLAAIVGLAWPVLVWLTPASQRPWISGTSNNSIWSLIMGYNGVGRVSGNEATSGTAVHAVAGHTATSPGGGAGTFGGTPGIFRYVNEALGGQDGWLLGLGLVGLLAIALVTRFHRKDERTGWLLIVGTTFLATVIVFSLSKGVLHPYYVSLTAPFLAALVGAFVALARDEKKIMRVIAPVGIVLAVIVQIIIINNVNDLSWLIPVLITVGLISCALVITGRKSLPWIGVLLTCGTLMLAPAIWSVETLGHATSATFPAGGPQSQGQGGAPGASGQGRLTSAAPPQKLFGSSSQGPPPQGSGVPPQGISGGAPGASGSGAPGGGSSQAELTYIRSHGGGTLATSSQQSIGQEVSQGDNIVALGGFAPGSTVTVSWLAQRVASGAIRWVDISGSGNTGGSSSVLSAVEKTCKLSSYTSTSASNGSLYDCQGYAGALAKL